MVKGVYCISNLKSYLFYMYVFCQTFSMIQYCSGQSRNGGQQVLVPSDTCTDTNRLRRDSFYPQISITTIALLVLKQPKQLRSLLLLYACNYLFLCIFIHKCKESSFFHCCLMQLCFCSKCWRIVNPDSRGILMC